MIHGLLTMTIGLIFGFGLAELLLWNAERARKAAQLRMEQARYQAGLEISLDSRPLDGGE